MKFLNSPDYYLLINPDMEILGFSKNLSPLWGPLFLQRLEVNKSLTSFIPAELTKDLPVIMELCLKGENLIMEYDFKFPNGRTVKLHLTVNPIKPGPDVKYLLISIQNSLMSTSSERSQKRALSKYAFLTSHNLRAPLSNILSLSHSITDVDDLDYEPGVIRNLLKEISTQAEALDAIIFTLNDLILNDKHNVSEKRNLHKNRIEKIMLIDDEHIVNVIHQKMLTSQWTDIEVKSFTNPEIALESLETEMPDLIMLDINMPLLNGWQVLQALERKQIDIDVVMVSSSIDPEERRRAFKFPNVKSFLNKPLTREQLATLLSGKI